MKHRLWIALSLLLLPSSGSTFADCYDCQSDYEQCAGMNEGRDRLACQMSRDLCLKSCGTGGSSRAAPQVWGAIARSVSSGTLGGAYGYRDQRSAEQAAVQSCINNENAMTNCQVIVHFHNACGAVAQALDGSWGSGWGSTVKTAGQEAIRICAGHGGVQCMVIASLCSGS
jgi:hypothetical protein